MGGTDEVKDIKIKIGGREKDVDDMGWSAIETEDID
jgi:hypothetical protein